MLQKKFIATSFKIPQNWKQPNISIGEKVNNVSYIYRME